MSRAGEIPAQLLRAPFRSTDAIRLGLTRHQLEGGRFRHVFDDVYAAAQLPHSLELECAAALLVLPSDAVFCGVTAARLYGLPVPDQDSGLHVAVRSAMPTPPRIRDLEVHEYTIPEAQLGWHDGWQVVRPERLFLELAAALPRLDLIVAGDAMLTRELTGPERLRMFLYESYRRRGVRRARQALPLLAKGVLSPPETRLRILLVDAGLPCPVVNQPVYGRLGDVLATPDLSYPEFRIAIQYEGGHHQVEREQYVYDIGRDDRLTDEGWIVVRITKEMLLGSPQMITNRIRLHLTHRRAAFNRAA
jgi:hypothetical protein